MEITLRYVTLSQTNWTKTESTDTKLREWVIHDLFWNFMTAAVCKNSKRRRSSGHDREDAMPKPRYVFTGAMAWWSLVTAVCTICCRESSSSQCTSCDTRNRKCLSQFVRNTARTKADAHRQQNNGIFTIFPCSVNCLVPRVTENQSQLVCASFPLLSCVGIYCFFSNAKCFCHF